MELQTAYKHMLIDVQDTTRLSLLGGTEERELIIMPAERSARAIAVWAAVEAGNVTDSLDGDYETR